MRTKPTAIRLINYELVKRGKRCCESCGATLRLNARNFYPQTDPRYFHYLCIPCEKPIMAQRERERYAASAEYRRQQIEKTLAYRSGERQAKPKDAPLKRELKRKALKAEKQERRKAFQRILASAGIGAEARQRAISAPDGHG